MYREVKVGNTTIPMLANGATPIRYRMVFGKDIISEFQMAEEDNGRISSSISELAYIMAMAAEAQEGKISMANLNQESFVDWLEKFEGPHVPVLRKIEPHKFMLKVRWFLQMRNEPVCHAIVIGSEDDREFLVRQSHFVELVRNLGLLVGNCINGLIHATVRHLAKLLFFTEGCAIHHVHRHIGLVQKEIIAVGQCITKAIHGVYLYFEFSVRRLQFVGLWSGRCTENQEHRC